MDTEGKVSDFLRFFSGQADPGLIVFDDESQKGRVRNLLLTNHYHHTTTWHDTLTALNEGKSVFIELLPELSKEFYLLLRQYVERRGFAQIMHPERLEIEQLNCDPSKCQILLLVDQSSLSVIERTIPVREFAGMVERI